jgi:S1-C subfamily serine protease
MTALDWLILTATALFAVSGYLRGLIVAALSLLGFALGALAGTRLAEALLPSGSASPYAPLFGLVGALIAGGILASGFEGVGLRLRRALPPLPVLGILDGLGGAAFSAAVALAIAWLLGTVLLAVPDGASLRSTIERSVILRRLDELLPPSGALLNAIARIDPLPSIGGREAHIAPAPAAIAHTPAAARAHRSVVRILGTACGLGIEGSGWVLAPNEVLTNAHVVAGERDTTVERFGEAPPQPATVVMFDPRDDLAILHVDRLGLPPLFLVRDPKAGTPAAILGYPQDGPFDIEPGRIGRTQTVLTQNAYGRGRVARALTPIRGLVRPGNSGGPMIDAGGKVVTTVFAATTSKGPRGGFGVANAVVARDLDRVAGPVTTQGCAG